MRRCCTTMNIVIFVLISAWMLSIVLILSRHPYDAHDQEGETTLRREKREIKDLKSRLHELSSRVEEFERFMEKFVPPPTYPPPSHRRQQQRQQQHTMPSNLIKPVPSQNTNHQQKQKPPQQQNHHHQQQQQHYSWASQMREVLKSQQSGTLQLSRTSLPPLDHKYASFPVFTLNEEFDSRSKAVETCKRTLWRTLKTTTKILSDGGSFVFTGDIDDLWLRDSAAQVNPYISLVNESPDMARLIRGLIQRHAMYIRFDPWANAFRIDTKYKFNAEQKSLGRHGYISTRNYELDSGCYYIRMLHRFWKTRSEDEPVLRAQETIDAVRILIDLWRSEQRHEENDVARSKLFDCKNCGKPYRYKTLSRQGKGSQTKYTGMTFSPFRPSDDKQKYGYLVPSNMFALSSLRMVVEMANELWHDSSISNSAQNLANDIESGIREHAIVNHNGKQIYAYEVDGLGNYNLMDDANIPSLMAIPYIAPGSYDPEIYEATREFVLSRDNPYFKQNRDGTISGIGSPHMEKQIKNNIWPMSLLAQGLTSTNLEEKKRLVQILLDTTGGTGWMHESFDANNPKKHTRKWFCWADALFAELVLSMTRDECLQKPWPALPAVTQV